MLFIFSLFLFACRIFIFQKTNVHFKTQVHRLLFITPLRREKRSVDGKFFICIFILITLKMYPSQRSQTCTNCSKRKYLLQINYFNCFSPKWPFCLSLLCPNLIFLCHFVSSKEFSFSFFNI